MTVLGLTRLRRHLLGRQTAFGTPIAAMRAYPFSGVPNPDLNWTDTEGDFGSRVIVAAPYRGIPNLQAPLTQSSLNYNDLSAQLAAFFGGAVSPSGAGTAKIWDWTPDYTAAGAPDLFSYERGSDTDGTGGKPNDWFQWTDGILTGLTIDSPEDGRGVLTSSMQWQFGDVKYAGNSEDVAAVPSITDVPDTDPTPIYLKDCKVYINTDPSDIGGDQITDAVHKFTLALTQEVDQKRYVNGSQAFDLDGYGMGAVLIQPTIVFGKTADTVGVGSESDAWFSDTAVPRYLQVAFESTRVAEEGAPDIPYSWMFSMPLRYYTREEGEIGQNETVTLTGKAFLDSDVLDYAFSTELVNTLAEADLGVL
jgi:hypothetical protein